MSHPTRTETETEMTSASTAPLEDVSTDRLDEVSGGAARVSGRGSDPQLTAMLSSLGDSIKDLAVQKNSGGDTMQLMLMMLMMGGGGGGGGVIAAPPTQGPPVINVQTAVRGGGGCGWAPPFRRRCW